MEIIDSIDKISRSFERAVVTIGNFDGVHIGHQSLFHEVNERADAINGTSVAVTFNPHPIKILKPGNHPPLITLHEQKTELIERASIDVLISIAFNPEFASLSAIAFVRDLLVNRIGMKVIVVGKDYTFGSNREGNLDFLRAYSQEFAYDVIVVDWKEPPDNHMGRISSTKIRELVNDGKVVEAQKMLGRHYQIRGTVATGRDRGAKLLGFPTANINLQDELCPKTGVYAVTAECAGKTYKAVANIGYSPTFTDHVFTVEVHILDFNKDIYGEKIRVNFIKRIRAEKKFANISELSDQIKKDIGKAREFLSI